MKGMDSTETAGGARGIPGRPGRPGGDAYWARVRRIVDQAPPLTDSQRAAIRAAFHTPALREAA